MKNKTPVVLITLLFCIIRVAYCAEIHKACYDNNAKEAHRLIKSNRSNLERTNANGHRAIHIATYKGYYDLLAYLLKWKPGMDPMDNCRRTPLHLAAYYGHAKCARLLLENGAKVNPLDKWGETPLDLAVKKSEPNTHYKDVNPPAKNEAMVKETVEVLKSFNGKFNKENKKKK